MQKCPKCNSEECAVETEDKIIAYFCLGCGYRTRSDFNIRNFEFQPTLIRMDEQIKKMVWKDYQTGLYWFPIDFNIPKVGILYAQGTVDAIEWVYMPMIELTDDEKKRYPGKKEIPDQARRKVFNSTNLKDALKLLKVIE